MNVETVVLGENRILMWKELIQNLSSECEFYAPAAPSEVAEAERSLNVLLPDELKDLLSESNGIHGRHGLGLVWPIERIVKDNLEFRQMEGFKELYMPFDPLLFFGDAGGGDQFAFAILDGTIRWPDIFVWDHENDSRTWAAPSLQRYLEWCLSGKLDF